MLSKKKFIKVEVKSFCIIEGDFSLSEFDEIIEKTQTDIIVRLSKNLGSKI